MQKTIALLAMHLLCSLTQVYGDLMSRTEKYIGGKIKNKDEEAELQQEAKAAFFVWFGVPKKNRDPKTVTHLIGSKNAIVFKKNDFNSDEHIHDIMQDITTYLLANKWPKLTTLSLSHLRPNDALDLAQDLAKNLNKFPELKNIQLLCPKCSIPNLTEIVSFFLSEKIDKNKLSLVFTHDSPKNRTLKDAVREYIKGYKSKPKGFIKTIKKLLTTDNVDELLLTALPKEKK